MKNTFYRTYSVKRHISFAFTAVLLLSAFNPLQAQKLGTCRSGHTGAVKSDGTAYTWGYNTAGQLGDSTRVNKNAPVAVFTSGILKGKTIKAIAMGAYHTVALTSDGKVYTWGSNTYGQLGNGDDSKASKFAPVAVSADGVLNGKTITAIAAGNYHSAALASDGTVYTWGDNTGGQLGNNDFFKNKSSVPVAVYTGASTSDALYGKTITAIAAGGNHTIALTNDGKVYTWGDNSFGQLGNGLTGSYNNSIVPVAVSGILAGKTITAISGGEYHTVVHANDGKIYAWGANSAGQLGNGSTSVSNGLPVAVSMSGVLKDKTIKAIAAGSYHTAALTNDGKVYTWGSNTWGELGNGKDNSTSINDSNVPAAVYTGTSASDVLYGKTITAIAAGSSYTIVMDIEGKVYTWGNNYYGQLGNGTTVNSKVAVAVNQDLMGNIPVELSAFTANLTASGVELVWQTATEVNNSGFEIERQYNNDEWVKIGELAGNGTSTSVHSYRYFDKSALAGSYKYRLKQINYDGSFEYSETITVFAGTPSETELVQNYPNPFNPATVISYRLSGAENVELSVYNMLGQKVAGLVNQKQEAGSYNVRFDASKLSSGIYIAKLKTGNYSKTIKMNLVK